MKTFDEYLLREGWGTNLAAGLALGSSFTGSAPAAEPVPIVRTVISPINFARTENKREIPVTITVAANKNAVVNMRQAINAAIHKLNNQIEDVIDTRNGGVFKIRDVLGEDYRIITAKNLQKLPDAENGKHTLTIIIRIDYVQMENGKLLPVHPNKITKQ